ncbi:MAG: hypothetical protein AAB783_00040 [Patescibacteria group bacterium]
MYEIMEILLLVFAVLAVARLLAGGENAARFLIVLLVVACVIAFVANFMAFTPTKLIP